MAVVLGYAFWVKIREVAFRINLLEIYVDLRDQVKPLGGLEDKGYLKAVENITALLGFTSYLSIPILFYLIWLARTTEHLWLTILKK